MLFGVYAGLIFFLLDWKLLHSEVYQNANCLQTGHNMRREGYV